MLSIFLGAIGKADQRNGRLFKSTYTSHPGKRNPGNPFPECISRLPPLPPELDISIADSQKLAFTVGWKGSEIS